MPRLHAESVLICGGRIPIDSFVSYPLLYLVVMQFICSMMINSFRLSNMCCSGILLVEVIERGKGGVTIVKVWRKRKGLAVHNY